MSALYTPNQLVAYNLARIRNKRGLTQSETIELLEPILGIRWSVASLSAAERSVDGKRIKEFNADELIAFSRAFDVPLAYWFSPPPADEQPRLAVPDAGDDGLDVEMLFDLVFGRADNRDILEQALLSGSRDSDPIAVADRLDSDMALRLRRRLHGAFGDIGKARLVLERLTAALEQLDHPDRNLSSQAGTNDGQAEPTDTGLHDKPRRRKP